MCVRACVRAIFYVCILYVCIWLLYCMSRCFIYVHMLPHTAAVQCEDQIDLLLKNKLALYSSTPISFSSQVSRSCFFFSHSGTLELTSLFSLPRFPSLSSVDCKCIRPLYGAKWVRFLINIRHFTGGKRKTPLCSSVSKSLPSSLSGERECPDLRNCLPALS